MPTMLRRASAVLAAVVVTATALVPPALVCRCVFTGERMVLTAECCPAEAEAASAPATLAAACCVTEEPPLLVPRVSLEREVGTGVPALTAALLPLLPVAAPPVGAGSTSPALARGSPAGLRHQLLSSVLRI